MSRNTISPSRSSPRNFFPAKSVLNLDNNRATVENRAAWSVLLSPLLLGIYVFTVMKMILMFQETAAYDQWEETRKREEKREEKFGKKSRLECVCQVAAGPGDGIVRYQQVLAIGIQSKIFFLRSRSWELRTWKDFISLSRTSQSIFSFSGHPFLLSFLRKPFIPLTKILLLFHLPDRSIVSLLVLLHEKPSRDK